jgi:hypothetical protein
MVRIKALFVLLAVTALSAYTIGRYSHPANHPPAPTVAHAHPAAAKATVPKARKVKATSDR